MNLSEAQVQALALSRQASQELDVKRREAIYNDVLTKQQMVRVWLFLSYVQFSWIYNNGFVWTVSVTIPPSYGWLAGHWLFLEEVLSENLVMSSEDVISWLQGYRRATTSQVGLFEDYIGSLSHNFISCVFWTFKKEFLPDFHHIYHF